MCSKSLEEFRNLLETEKPQSLSLGQGLKSNHDKNSFNELLPETHLNLIQHDKFKEGFQTSKSTPSSNNCTTYCGKKTPYCKSTSSNLSISCENTNGLDTKEKCQKAYGGGKCEWKTNDWRTCSPQCKKWNCANCKSVKTTSALDELQQSYNDTLKEWKAAYTGLGKADLTESERQKIQNNVAKLNTRMKQISTELYKKITELKQVDIDQSDEQSALQTDAAETARKIKGLKRELRSSLPRQVEMGEYADNELRVNYAYYHYLLWLIVAAILIGAITMLTFSIPFPDLKWPWKGIYVLLVLSLAYFLFSRIYAAFWRTVRYLAAL